MDTTIGRSLQAARQKAGVRAEAACVAADVSLPTLKRWESGHTAPRVDQLRALADAYGCTPADLLSGIDQ